jgi:spermidine synthase
MAFARLLFFASGACALIYEVVWTRQLLLVMGTTTGAVSAVLSAFMVGLGIGGRMFGPLADRSRSPLRLYAYLEAGVGLYALILPALIAGSVAPYVALARLAIGRPALLVSGRVLLVSLLLLPPTLLMGGTLPALIRHVARGMDTLGSKLSALYGANLWGGVAGSLLCGFALIREFGVRGASLVAATGNLSLAVIALLVADRSPAPDVMEHGETSRTRPPAEPGVAQSWLWIAVFSSGFVGLGYQILWTRMLIFSFGSTVYSFAIILATVLAGLALGSRLFGLAEQRFSAVRVLSVSFLLAGVTAVPFGAATTRSTDLIETLAGHFGVSGGVFLASAALCAALCLLVPATFMGVVLPLGLRLLVEDVGRSGRGIGRAYLVNTLGCVLGSLGVAFLLMPALGLRWGLLALSFLQVALGLAIWCSEERGGARWRAVATSCVAFLIGTLALLRVPGTNPFDSIKERGGSAAIVRAHRDATAASVTVVDEPGGLRRSLRIDGFVASGAGVPRVGYMAMMTHLPMLLHPAPTRLLVICFGTGTTAGAGLSYPGVKVDVVDINATVFDFARYFSLENHGVATDPRARLIVDDGRNYLLTTAESYDVITSEPMPPKFAGVVNLYSKEYYEIARERLRPGGILAQWLPFHLLTFEESLAILRTVRSVFPETTLWLHSGTGIIVARRDGPIQIDFERLRWAFGEADLRGDLARRGVRSPLDFASLHVVGPALIDRATERVPLITDERPSLEFHKPTHLLMVGRGVAEEGFLTAEQSLAMQWVWLSEASDQAPLVGAAQEEQSAVASRRVVSSREALGDLYALWDRADLAFANYEAAADAALEAGTRARLLLRAARLAEREGRRAEAVRLASESLAAAPGGGDAADFLHTLEGGPRPPPDR